MQKGVKFFFYFSLLTRFEARVRATLLGLAVPYQQGLSIVAAVLLRHVAQDDYVRTLHALISTQRYGLASIFGSAGGDASALPWIPAFQAVFEELLPNIAALLRAKGVDVSVVVSKWVRTAFADALPEPVLVRVWDLYFLHGLDFLFRVAVALFALVEGELHANASAGNSALMRLLNDLPSHAMARIASPQELIEQCFLLRAQD